MSDLTLEILKNIQARLDTIEQRLGQMDLHLVSIDSHLSGDHASDVAQSTAIVELRGRIERIEKRLELVD